MIHLFLLVTLSTTPGPQLPAEVEAFIEEREICEHFRGEPIDGNAHEQIERRAFVQESIEIHCAGSDRRLGALRRRYASDAAVISALSKYDSPIEGSQCITEGHPAR